MTLHKQAALAAMSFFVVSIIQMSSTQAEETQPPMVEREFRAAWVATVANIDWPSRPGLSTKKQQQELLAIFDRAVELNLNAIIFQVRPHCDALYASELEPWSEYLSGAQGKPPKPYYDPLEFAVHESHKRGLELHAWFNPYRASHPQGKSKFADNHISKIKPNAVKKYGKYNWLDPSDSEASQHSMNVFLDVVRRYDIDGIHFDDYFYPYPEKDDNGNVIEFPDDASWELAKKNGETLSRDDWRRQSVNRLLEQVAIRTKELKPWVKFGVSPFGIWRPGYPESIRGFDPYSAIFADSLHWFREGIVDYFTPQLYWNIDSSGQSYPVLLEWWNEQNTHNRHLWPGNFTSRVKSPQNGNWPIEEIVRQIEITRKQDGATGNVHFSMIALMKDETGLAKVLAEGLYKEPALIPASPWLGEEVPDRPIVSVSGKKALISLPNSLSPSLWVVQAQSADAWTTKILSGDDESFDFDSGVSAETPKVIAVSAVNRIGNQGPANIVHLQGP